MFTQAIARWRGMLETWDRPSRFGLFIALGLLGCMVIAGAIGPEALRQPALIGAGGLLIIIQIIVMWGNRGMVTPYNRAQHAYIAGDFETALTLLNAQRAAGKGDVQSLTLLGNTYRQLGQLEASAERLQEALALRPTHYFPLIGFGRTLLAMGHYDTAAETFQKALDSGAPPIVQFDLGEIRYRQGLSVEARDLLQSARPFLQETYHVLMAEYLLFRLSVGAKPSPEQIESGLPFWEASAERFHETPYGQALLEDVHSLHELLEES